MRLYSAILAMSLLALLAGQSQAQEKRPVKLRVLVPADATLEINGSKTKQQGPERSFEMPALETGHKYKVDFVIGIGKQRISHSHTFFHGKKANTISVDLHKVVKSSVTKPLATRLPDLLKALGDPKIKSSAAFAIERKALEAFKNAKGEGDDAKLLLTPATIEYLRKALADDEPGVRSNIARALGHMGPAARSALPDLERMQKKDTAPSVRDAVNDAIRNIR